MTRYFLGRDGGMPTPVPDDEPGNRAETLAHSAFYTEVKVVPLDAIVIRREELPEVVAREDGSAHYTSAKFNGTTYGPPISVTGRETPDAVHAQGLARIALAEHLREHPPVDEAETDALTDALLSETELGFELTRAQVSRIARRLIAKGVRVGGESR